MLQRVHNKKKNCLRADNPLDLKKDEGSHEISKAYIQDKYSTELLTKILDPRCLRKFHISKSKYFLNLN